MNPPGLMRAGSAVIVTGPMLEVALRAVAIAARDRRRNGVPASPAYDALSSALAAAVAASGHDDDRAKAVVQLCIYDRPTVTIDAAAQRLRLSRRQARRLAPKLGGRLLGGRWLLDDDAIREYLERQQHA